MCRTPNPEQGSGNVNSETHISKYPTLQEVFLLTYPTYPFLPTYRQGCASCTISAFWWWFSPSYGCTPNTTTSFHHQCNSCEYIGPQRTGMNGKMATVYWCSHSPAFHLEKAYSLLLLACEMRIRGPFPTHVSAEDNPSTPSSRCLPCRNHIPGGQLGDIAGEEHTPLTHHQDLPPEYQH